MIYHISTTILDIYQHIEPTTYTSELAFVSDVAFICFQYGALQFVELATFNLLSK